MQSLATRALYGRNGREAEHAAYRLTSAFATECQEAARLLATQSGRSTTHGSIGGHLTVKTREPFGLRKFHPRISFPTRPQAYALLIVLRSRSLRGRKEMSHEGDFHPD